MNCMLLAAMSVMCFAMMQETARADAPEIPLWPNGAPGAKGSASKDIPSLTPFLPEAGKANGCAIVVCPGGGYQGLAPHEGRDYALFLNQHGITCFVLKYRLAPDYHYPEISGDAARAMRWVRANAEQYKIDPKRIGIIGSSAGGHLASTLMTHFDAGDPKNADPIDQQSSRPDFGILCYPVISMQMDSLTHGGSRDNLLGKNPSQDLMDLLSNEKQVKPNTPPCFLVHGADDKTVPVENSLMFAEALAKNHVPFELHIYEHARHGFGLEDKYPFAHPHPWTAALMSWMSVNKFIPQSDVPRPTTLP